MGRRIYGMDIGTSMMKLYRRGSGIVLAEKNVIALEDNKRVLAIGDSAYEMMEKAPERIEVSMPVRNGVIADIGNMQLLLNKVLEKIGKGRIRNADYLVAVPTDITKVEKKAFYDLVRQSNGKAKNVSVVDKPIAAALGMDIDVTESRGVMTVDMGADTTEIAIMSLGGIVISKIIPTGGKKLDASIKVAVKKKHNLFIGDKTAEKIKFNLASATEPERESMRVFGRDVVTGLPQQTAVDSIVVYDCIKEHLHAIVSAIRIILERTPPEISSDIIEAGVYITGGSAKIKNLKELVEMETTLKVNIADDSEHSVVKGLGVMIENKKLMSLASVIKQ